MTKTRPRLTRNIYVVSAVSFLQDTASEILYPILPFFVTGVLGAPPVVLGLIEGTADGIASATKAFSGRLADLGAAGPLSPRDMACPRLAKRCLLWREPGRWSSLHASPTESARGCGPPRDTIIADESTVENRGRAFGFHRAADTAGAVLGPLIGLSLFFAVGQQFRTLFWIALIPATLSVVVVFLIREHPRSEHHRHDKFSVKSLPRRYWRFITLIAVFSAMNFPDAMLLLRAKDLGLGFTDVTFLYVLYNVSYAVLSYPAGVVSDRSRRSVVFGVGLAVFAAAYLGFGLTSTTAWMWFLFPFMARTRQ